MLQVTLSRLHLHDLTAPAVLEQHQQRHHHHHLPPPARASPLPRVARLVSADRLSLSHASGSASGGGSSAEQQGPAVTHVELVDLSLEGYAGEAGSFIDRCAS